MEFIVCKKSLGEVHKNCEWAIKPIFLEVLMKCIKNYTSQLKSVHQNYTIGIKTSVSADSENQATRKKTCCRRAGCHRQLYFATSLCV